MTRDATSFLSPPSVPTSPLQVNQSTSNSCQTLPESELGTGVCWTWAIQAHE